MERPRIALKETTPTALSQSVPSELLEAFRAGDSVDLIRESVRMVTQVLIDAVAAERTGAIKDFYSVELPPPLARYQR